MKKLIGATLVLSLLWVMGSSIFVYAEDVSPTPTPVVTATPTPDVTVTPTPTPTLGADPTMTPAPTATATETPEVSATPVSSASPEPSSTPTISTVGKNQKIDKTDPLYIELLKKNGSRIALCASEEAIWKEIKAQEQLNKETMKLVNEKAQAQSKGDQSSIDAIKLKIKSFNDQKIALLTLLSDAYKAKDKPEIKNLQGQIKTLNNQIKEQNDLIKSSKESLKNSNSKNKEFREGIKQLKDLLKKNQNATIFNLHYDILGNRSSKDAEWIGFRTAMQKADLTNANLHMDNILTFKQSILTNLGEILTEKKKIGEDLNYLLAH